jgi:hypothetical protein
VYKTVNQAWKTARQQPPFMSPRNRLVLTPLGIIDAITLFLLLNNKNHVNIAEYFVIYGNLF